MDKINHEIILKNKAYQPVALDILPVEDVLRMHRFMVRLRRLQEAIFREYHHEDLMRCPVHFGIGQESVASALSCFLRKDDFFFSHHRCHGYFLAKGGAMDKLLAELHGRSTGTNGGMAGSQEISSPQINFYGGAILSGLMAIAVGAGLGLQFHKKTHVAVAGFGDGAVDEGIFWEAINYAQLCRLPVVFICENNGYSTYSPQLKRQTRDNIHERVAAFGLKTMAFFGNDAVDVNVKLAEAFAYAREGKGPVFIEAYTYRWNAHVGPEDDDYVGYRSVEEREFWKKLCPIMLLEQRLRSGGLWNDEKQAGLLREIDQEIDQAFTFAKNSPFPDGIDWEDQNFSFESPLADKLLKDDDQFKQFNMDQAETRPEPY